jgi:hypothetical protein
MSEGGGGVAEGSADADPVDLDSRDREPAART